MIIRAPAMRAPWIVARPTPPAPKTATVEPGSTRAVFSAAAGRDAAADEGRLRERHLIVDLHDRILVDQHLLGVRGEVGELVDGLAVPHELRRLVLLPHRPCLAEVRLTGEAVIARPAEH